MIRIVLFLLGLALMAVALVIGALPNPPPQLGSTWLYGLGLAPAVGSHGWPDGLG